MKRRSLFETIFSSSPESLGKYGENRIARTLGWNSVFGKKGIILRNVYVPMQDGQTTEIDILFLTEKGIFVIESKDYSGYIFGSDDRKNWTVTLYA